MFLTRNPLQNYQIYTKSQFCLKNHKILICGGDIDTYRHDFQTEIFKKSPDLSFSDIDKQILKILIHNFEKQKSYSILKILAP